MIDLLVLSILIDNKKNIYEIKQEIDRSFFLFLKSSFGSLHPALKRLENYGCVTAKNKLSSGGQKKSVYSITDKGRGYFESLMLKDLPVNPLTAIPIINVKLIVLSKINPENQKKIIKSMVKYLEIYENSGKNFLKDNEEADNFAQKFIKHNLIKISEDIKWLNSLTL
jgi:DNA-binding PadR family transcriptional regulator